MLAKEKPSVFAYHHFVIVLLFILNISISAAAQIASACTLLRPAELESVLGGKIKSSDENNLGDRSYCNIEINDLKVMIRLASKKNKNSDAEIKGAEILRKQGWGVTIKTEGKLTLSTLIPPENLKGAVFTTSASILDNGRVLAVEISAVTKNKMVSTETAKNLVQKAFSRL